MSAQGCTMGFRKYWRRHGFRILLPLPCLTVKIDPEDENSTLARQSARKTEISKDFSAFFAPNFFKISIDPSSIFFRVEGFELPQTQFFQNFITNESNTKGLNPRQGLGLFRFFVLVTKCLHTDSGCNRLCFSLLGAEIQPAVFVLFIRHFCFLSHLVPKRHRFISILFVYKHLFRQLHVVADNGLLSVQIIYFEFVDFSERNHICYDCENNTQSRSGKTRYKIRLG